METGPRAGGPILRWRSRAHSIDEIEQERSRRSAEDAEFMLHADNIGLARIQHRGGSRISRPIILIDRGEDLFWEFVAAATIDHRNHIDRHVRICLAQGLVDTLGKSGDAAFAGGKVADERDSADIALQRSDRLIMPPVHLHRSRSQVYSTPAG